MEFCQSEKVGTLYWILPDIQNTFHYQAEIRKWGCDKWVEIQGCFRQLQRKLFLCMSLGKWRKAVDFLSRTVKPQRIVDIFKAIKDVGVCV